MLPIFTCQLFSLNVRAELWSMRKRHPLMIIVSPLCISISSSRKPDSDRRDHEPYFRISKSVTSVTAPWSNLPTNAKTSQPDSRWSHFKPRATVGTSQPHYARSDDEGRTLLQELFSGRPPISTYTQTNWCIPSIPSARRNEHWPCRPYATWLTKTSNAAEGR